MACSAIKTLCVTEVSVDSNQTNATIQVEGTFPEPGEKFNLCFRGNCSSSCVNGAVTIFDSTGVKLSLSSPCGHIIQLSQVLTHVKKYGVLHLCHNFTSTDVAVVLDKLCCPNTTYIVSTPNTLNNVAVDNYPEKATSKKV